jgi:hypothetical protein
LGFDLLNWFFALLEFLLGFIRLHGFPWLFLVFLLVLLIVLDCEHVVVLNAVLEQLNCAFLVELRGWVFPECECDEGVDVVGESLAQDGVELGVVLVLLEAEDVVDELEGLLQVVLGYELVNWKLVVVVFVVFFVDEASVVIQEAVELGDVAGSLRIILGHMLIFYL